MITIGIPFYNSERFLNKAIKSVLAQSFKDWELILVDDGSTDNSLDIAKYYESKDARIKVISDGVNRRLPYRLNQIVREAKYDLIARMDADDLMSPIRLETQLNFMMNNPLTDIVASKAFSIDDNDVILGLRKSNLQVMSANSIIKGSVNIIHPSILGRRAWFLRNPYVEEGNLLAEDYELWLSAAVKNDLNYIILDDYLYYYRDGNILNPKKLMLGYTSQISIIKKYSHIISYNKFLFILLKIRCKSIFVFVLSKLGLLNLLLKNRFEKFSSYHIKQYTTNLNKINNI